MDTGPHQLLAGEDLEEKIRALPERVQQLESPSGKERCFFAADRRVSFYSQQPKERLRKSSFR
jgi:hypothetical protein